MTSIPAAPGNLQTSTASNPSVILTWSDVTGDNRIQCLSLVEWGRHHELLGTTNPHVLTFTDTTSVENASYEYAVTAINDSGESDPSDIPSATTFLAQATGLIAQPTTTQVSLSWTDHSSRRQRV